ncbi:MAG TPA: GAF domain-containing protein, partial [Casimicrobiaceae bacterium]|nr:GAF domain-containing protein [Casimicrobiaceae bacterium]
MMRKQRNHRPAKRPAPATTVVPQVRELAWAGQHARAIELATQAFADAAPGERIDLLDLRCESYLAQGEIDRAREDAATLVELATRTGDPARIAQAGNRAAIVQIRGGESKAAIATAEAALIAARKARDRILEATSQLRLAEACVRVRDHARSIAGSRASARLFRTLRRPVGENRALWALSAALSSLGRIDAARRAGREALDIARKCGDLYGIGNAAIILQFDEADTAVRFRALQESLAAFTGAGYLERQAVVTHNLGLNYYGLGLYRRAHRHFLRARETYLRTGAKQVIVRTTWMLAFTEAEIGHHEVAAKYMRMALDEIDAVGDEDFVAVRTRGEGWLAFHDGDVQDAARHGQQAADEARGAGAEGIEMLALTELARALLGCGEAGSALDATTRATRLHAKHGFTSLQDIEPPMLWWQHSRALAASGKSVAARKALDRAYRFVVEGIATLGDEGLRRNYLNKVAHVREIVTAWLAASSARRSKALSPHLAGEANLGEPFERLVDTGLRLNEIRSSDELREFLIDEAVELSGAERVLLVLETPAGRKLAGAQTPKGENAERLMGEIAPLLDEVQRTRMSRLDYVPVDDAPLSQRSRIVAPLVAQQTLLGFLYADIDGAFGRFHDADRDLLAMLASQAAVALANAQWSEGLEAKVAERTAEVEQRAAELALINSIQQGLAAKLDFQAIVDGVGDKLREVFKSEDLSIRWWDPQSDTIVKLYSVEHGQHLPKGPPRKVRPDNKPVQRMLREGIGGYLGTREEQLAAGTGGATPGTDFCLSIIGAPIRGTQRVLGMIVIEDHEREHAYGDSDLRVLTTIGATLGVALENARLFDETQRLLKETEQRNAELAVINSVQQGMAAKLDFQAIVDLVGDTLREVFTNGDIGIRWYDRNTNLIHFLYQYEHGERLHHAPTTPGPRFLRMCETREPEVYHNLAEQNAAGVTPIPGTDQGLSFVVVPILGGDRVLGTIALENYERENAYSDAEVRLVKTIAASMGVALENARLFDETQRLLKETEQRAAELAVINSIQQGIASKLDFQAIVDLVGDKLREVFGIADMAITWIEETTRMWTFPYVYERGSRIHHPPKPFNIDTPVRKSVIARQTVVAHTSAEVT